MTIDPLGDAARAAFNFSRAGLIAVDQTRTLRALDEQFARNLTHTLGAWLRSNVSIVPLLAEQLVFGNFTERIAIGCYVLPLTMMTDTQKVRGVFSLSLSFAPAIIDLLLGGSGRTGEVSRELTEIEEAVLASVIELILREWTSAWASLAVEFCPEAQEREDRGQRLMAMQERVFCCTFQVTLAELSGELSFCLPSAAVVSSLRAVAHRRDRQRQRTQEERSRMLHRLRSAGVCATLSFPAMQLRASELRNLQAGKLLALPLSRSSAAELRVGGSYVFRAEAVRSGDHRAARIVQAPESQMVGSTSDE